MPEGENIDPELEATMRKVGEVFATLKGLNLQLAELIERGVDINDAELLEGLLDDPLKMMEHIKASNGTFQHAFEEGAGLAPEQPPQQEEKKAASRSKRRI